MNSSAGSLEELPSSVTWKAVAPAHRTILGRLAFPLAFVVIALMVATLYAGILKYNHGTFVYTLDDPYIHLALSDQIRHGNYGLQAGTHAAPSSSILFPFLLAIVSGTAIHPYLPLILNVCALFFTVEIMRRFLLHLRLGEDDVSVVIQAAALVLMTLCFNLVGVVFTGLEHSLHIAAVAAIVYGLVIFLDTDRMPGWLPVALVLSPLFRYEGVALSIGVLLVLALRGRARTAITTFFVIILLLVGFSLFLVKLGLPPLPSSILAKSAVAAGGVGGSRGGLLSGLILNFDLMDGHPIGLMLLLALVASTSRCVYELLSKDFSAKPWRWSSDGLVCLALVCGIGGHAAAGRFGWLDRYEDYLVVGFALCGIYLAQSAIRSVLAMGNRFRLLFAVSGALSLGIFGSIYWHTTLLVPHASNNIYEQQLQMHHFINDYWKQPVAVNDLGLASYHNPNFVLDLGGLGSEKARHLMASHANADAYQAFVAANGVHLVIIYQEWFPGQIPDDWEHVGTLSLSRPHLSAAHDDVQFYATDAITGDVVRHELGEFEKTLPSRVKLTID